MVVLSCDHAGLRPEFQRLEDEIRRTLENIDHAVAVRLYVRYLQEQSRWWREAHTPEPRER